MDTISVVIVTYKRPDDLKNCLQSILSQTLLPQEVIVVDNARNISTKRIVRRETNRFEAKRIKLLYIENTRGNSLAAGRNIGVERSRGSVVSFVDDDALLDKEYHAEIMKVYKLKPAALGVQGYNQTTKASHIQKRKKRISTRLRELFGKIFQPSILLEKERCRVLPSLCVTYPDPSLNRIINCQWLSGTASTYRRDIVEKFKYDENLRKYSWGEDQDTPYRIFKKYPRSLFLTPYAKFWHNVSQEGRMANKEFIYMGEVYDFYLFHKLIEQSFSSKAKFIWRKIGNILLRRLLFNLLTLRIFTQTGFRKVIYSLGALFACLSHLKEIKEGRLDFFNKTLT